MGAPVLKDKLVHVPGELEYLKSYWVQCHRGEILTYQELFYFQEIIGCKFDPWESEIIIQIDNIYWNSKNGHSDTNRKGRGNRG